MGFIKKYYFFPLICTPASIFLCSLKSYILHFSSQQLLFVVFPAILPEARSFLRIIEGSKNTPHVARSLCSSLLVFQGLLMLFLMIILSSWDVIFLFFPHLSRRWMLMSPSSSAVFTILSTVDLAMPNRSAICLIDWPLRCLSATT